LNQLLDVKPWPRVIWQNPLLILAAFLVGGALAFAYSYAPLHRAKDWQVDYLEDRLEARNEQVRGMETQLEDAEGKLADTPSGEELSALKSQLAEATDLIESRKREIASLKRKLEATSRSRDSWKTKYASALSELENEKSRAAAAVAPRRSAVEPDPLEIADEAPTPEPPTPPAAPTP
jgi:septal ring factor EnvC (AmiA/AmiB activator)